MYRYDAQRLICGLVPAFAVFFFTMWLAFRLPVDYAEAVILTVVIPLLFLLTWAIAYVLGVEKPEETHEFCDRRLCYHARVSTPVGRRRKH